MDILVVEDSNAMRMMIKRMLRRTDLDIDRIEDASDGVEALEVLEDFVPDVVMADWNMSNMDGMELLHRAREKYEDLTYGFVTSQVSDHLKEQAEEADADFYITKPFSESGFRSVLKEYE